jgi:hypothetical protein
MSFSTEPVRNRHRPGIRVIDTREYGGKTRIGPRRLFDDMDVLREAREHKAKQSGAKYVDGIPASEFV